MNDDDLTAKEKARLRAEWEATLTPQDRAEIKIYMSKLGAMGGLRRGRRKCRGDSEYYRQLGAANNTNMEAARAGRARKKAERDKAKQEDKT
jgi:hypothetical protein